ncbi:MAG: response regulator [Pseudomonadota bacterium]
MTKTILLVDDEEDIRLVLGLALADLGYRVLTAENGQEGLAKFREFAPPIIITDIKMPDIDGVELLRKIKRENPDAEVIMITGHGDMDVAIKSFQHQAVDFITKPIDVESLEKALVRVEEKILARSKLREYTQSLEGMVLEKVEILSGLQKGLAGTAPNGRVGDPGERFHSLFEGLPSMVLVVDENLRLIDANRSFREKYGNRPWGRFCHSVMKQKDQPCSDCPARQTFSSGLSQQAETEVSDPGGLKSRVLVWTAPVRDARGRVSQALLLLTDMSRILRIQDHLSSLGLQIGSISHGLKGLLTGLDGGMYMLDSGLKRDNDALVQEGLDVVKRMIRQIRNMVLDVLLFSKDRDIKKERLPLLDFSRDAVAAVEAKARELGIAFEFFCDPAAGFFEIDPALGRTALVNILENALEACREDRDKPAHQVCFRAEKKEGFVVFEITDNGLGMDPKTKGEIFNLFFSGKGPAGTGLGLFITKRIVQQHGGTVEVESTLGKGTSFIVKIPEAGETPGA